MHCHEQSLSCFLRSRVHILEGLTDASVACALCVDASAGPAALAARLPHVQFDLGVEDGSRMTVAAFAELARSGLEAPQSRSLHWALSLVLHGTVLGCGFRVHVRLCVRLYCVCVRARCERARASVVAMMGSRLHLSRSEMRSSSDQ